MATLNTSSTDHLMNLGELLIDSGRSVDANPDVLARWYALIDMSAFASLEDAASSIGAITAPVKSWVNLYADMDGLELASQGPHLARLLDDPQAYEGFSLSAKLARSISFLWLHEKSMNMTTHLLALREVALPDGSTALFRFQDPRVIAALMPLLDVAQRVALMGPAQRWVCTDSCGQRHGIVRPEVAKKANAFRPTAKQLAAVDEALLPYEVLAQTREADSAALARLNECQQLTSARDHIAQARSRGLNAHGDLSLYCVLAFQLPVGFADESPFNEAIAEARSGKFTFSQGLAHADPRNWEKWNDLLARQDGMKN
jgi:Domain of unknown function (DUF4123)